MFFEEYFPNAKRTFKSLITEIIYTISPNKNLFMEVATARGRNLRQILRLGWTGKVVGFDIWEGSSDYIDVRCPKPTIERAELIQGNVLDTLIPYYNNEHIDVLFLDLDSDPIATPFTLDVLANGLQNSLIFVDEFHSFDQWQNKDAHVLAQWLAQHQINFDILYYTEHGALIQTGGGYPPTYLLDCLTHASR
jgi:hypothetical protein